MKLLMLSVLVVAARAATLPQGYSLPQPTGGVALGGFQNFQTQPSFTGGGGNILSGVGSVGSGIATGGQGLNLGNQNFVTSGSVGRCPDDQVRQMDGTCVTPIVRRNLFVYRAPAVSPIVGPRPDVLPPRVEHNVVFIHTSNGIFGEDPIVVPPPQQKNVIYVLNKRPEIDHSVLEFPPPEQVAPEIFFINYADGENPQLPGGGDLQSALSQAAESDGEIIGHKDAIISTGQLGLGTGVVGVVGGSVGGPTPSNLYSTP